MWETKFVIIYSYRNEIKELVQLFRWWGEDKTIDCPPFFMAQNTMANSTNIIKWWRRNISITQGWIQMEMSTSGWRVCHTLACRSIVRPSAPIILTKCRSIYFVLLFSWKRDAYPALSPPVASRVLYTCSSPYLPGSCFYSSQYARPIQWGGLEWPSNGKKTERGCTSWKRCFYSPVF